MPLIDLLMPKLGESIMEATILKWHKKVGDSIQIDETILDIATDKVDSEVPSTASGIIKETFFNVNDVVPIGALIARIEVSEQPIQANLENDTIPFVPIASSIRTSTSTSTLNSTVPSSPTLDIQIPTTLTKPTDDLKFYSPLVLNIAQSEGLALNELQFITGTGNQGRVTKNDILNYLASRKLGNHLPNQQFNVPTQTNTTPSYQNSTSILSNPEDVILSNNTSVVEMDRMRKLIAKHMVESVQTSPHVCSFIEADVTNMVLWREKVKKPFEQSVGTKLTFTPLFFECIANALTQFPIVNASIQNDQIIYKKDINIGMATALPNGNLIVPVIKGANQLSIIGLSKAVNTLAHAARNNQLKPNDTQSGTFTVTNIGTFGSLMGTPIINQPQVAILALGAIKKRPVVMETELGDVIAIRHMMYLSLSYDHRIVDGAIGSLFLAAVAKAFESWDVKRQYA